MTSGYRIGDLVVYKVEYKDPEGVVRGKPRPLIIISEPNSKGDYLAIAGSTKIHQWFEEKHILIAPDMVLGGSLDKPTIFPASKQILIDSRFVRAQIGNIPVEYLETLLRQCFSQYTKAFFQGVHAPRIEAPFNSGRSPVHVSGRVYGPDEMENLVDSALDFWLTTGRFNDAFEKRFAQFLGVKHVFTINSGSSANLLAVAALTSSKLGEKRLKPGDEVITVAAAFPTTVAPILQYGLIPVFVDVDIPTYNIRPDLIEPAVSAKTRAVMLAHTLGNPFDVNEVLRVARKYDLWVIEDSCDALGSRYYLDSSIVNRQSSIVGTFGHLSTFSFYPAHHITMGEGGAVATDDNDLKRILESFRDWGRDCWCATGKDNTCGKRFSQEFGELPYGYDHKYVYSHFGYNLKITDMQAAIGCAQLDKLPAFIETRKRNWRLLRDGLSDLEDRFILPEASPNSDPSWFGFPLTVRENAGFSRDEIVTLLESKGIQTRMLFSGNLIRHPCFDDMRKTKTGFRVAGELKNTDVITNRTFWIGVYPGITEEMIGYAVEQIRGFAER